MQRQKGKVGERAAVDQLKQIGLLNAGRKVRNHEHEDDIVDEALPGVSFECKLEKRSAIGPAIRQAIAQAGDKIPAVLHRQACRGERGNPWCLTIRISDLPELLELYARATHAEPQGAVSSGRSAPTTSSAKTAQETGCCPSSTPSETPGP